MLFDEAGEVVEMFKNSFPLSFLFFVPLLIIMSPVSPVGAAHDFAVYRMQQYDLQGTAYGCRNALVNMEARPLSAQMLARRCVVAKLKELTIDKYKELVSQSTGGLVILLPSNLTTLSNKDREHLLDLEQDLMQEETQMPVYFAHETPELLDIYEQVQTSVNSDHAGSAAEAMLRSASANGFQLVVSGSQSHALSDFQIVNVQGKLAGYGIEEQLPTIAIVAHYDTYGIAPSLSKGGDSNGSGVVALLELARLFSKLYTNSRTHSKFNLLFLLSGGGKFNYQGTKKWIEDGLDSTESSLLTDASYVLCLDALGSGDNIHVHVSKPPREGSAADILLQNLKSLVRTLYPEVKIEMVHKKINLAEDILAWEHERFSIRRLPALTMSHLDSHKKLIRNSILDTRESVDIKVLSRNVKLIAESLARHIFNLTSQEHSEIFIDALAIEPTLMESWLSYLTSVPRSAQLITKDHPLIATLEQSMGRYLKDVKKTSLKADKIDPDFMFYSGAQYTMNAYSVKPAIFDLFLGVGIAAYLGIAYLLLQNFSTIYAAITKLSGSSKLKSQ